MHGRSVEASPGSARGIVTVTVVLLVVAALVTWVVTAVLFAFVIPAMLGDTWPLALPESAAAGTRIAAIGSAVIGVAMIAGTLAVVSGRANTAGRVVLVVSGVAAVVVGLLHATGGISLLAHGSAMRPTAITMLIVSTALVGVGVVAGAAGLSRLLPGRSLAQRAIVQQPQPLTTSGRQRMLAWTGAAAVAWAAIVALFLATIWPGIEATAFPVAVFAAAVLLPPILTGSVIGGWREGAANRLSTLGLAAGGGVATEWLFLVILWLWELTRFPGQDLASAAPDLDVPIVFAMLGAFLGAAGYGLERALAHIAGRRKGPPIRRTQAPGSPDNQTSVSKLWVLMTAVLWIAVLPFAFWLERNPDAPTELAIAEFVLALVVVPLMIGAVVGAWRRNGVLPGALSALLAAWAWLVIGVVVSLLTRFEFETMYLRTEWPEALLVLAIFGLAGAVMGALGAAVARQVYRHHAPGTA